MKHLLNAYLLIAMFSVMAQNNRLYTDDKKAIVFYQEAVAISAKRAMFVEAIELLQRALKRDDNFIDAYHRMGYCYERLGKNQEAIQSYNTCIAIDSNYYLNKESRYWLSKLYYEVGEYDSAIVQGKKYMALGVLNPSHSKEIEDVIYNARYSLELIRHPVDFSSIELPKNVNFFAQQYFPALTIDQNQIFFTARRGYTGAYDEDIYYCTRERVGDSSIWSRPNSVSPRINSPANEGAVSISADGKIMIFTSCQGRNSFGSCDLYFTEKIGDEWKAPTNLGRPVNSPAWEAQPSLSADGRTIYFASNRSGGKGKRDIWVTHRVDEDKWSEPVNLGDSINTSGDEVSPFIHVNGQTLFFSSNKHVGLGGFDIFSSERQNEDQHWTTPKNLGYPINTMNDQVSLFITADGEKAYYTNDTKIGLVVESKLHYFEIPQDIRIEHTSSFLKGTVRDKDTNKPLSSVIELYDLFSGELISKVKSDPVDGTYLVVLTEGKQYSVYVKKKGYVLENFSYDYKEKPSMEPEVLDIYLRPIKPGETAVLNNIFFGFDSYALDEKSKTELREVYFFLKDNYGVRIEIGGHTDNEGAAAYNKTLSLNRAKTVYDFLCKNGVPSRLLEYKGYGSSTPVVPNTNDANKKLNRRIEFKIVE